MTVAEILAGNRLALSRALSAVENETPEGEAILSELYRHGGKGYLVGVTGSPGTGKSTLVNQLVLQVRKQESRTKIAILAVDPTSPFSGGAVLGDRVRMRDLSGDPDIFIRSMASRGASGGLAERTLALARVFDGAGYDWIFIETVGAGQSEVEIAGLAHTTLVVEAPGLGDDIQAIKAGILEIADILVLNKADQPGVDAAEKTLRAALDLTGDSNRRNKHTLWREGETEPQSINGRNWRPPLLRTVATKRDGAAQLWDAICAHREWLQESGQWQSRERERAEMELTGLVRNGLFHRWQAQHDPETIPQAARELLSREISPDRLAQRLLDKK